MDVASLMQGMNAFATHARIQEKGRNALDNIACIVGNSLCIREPREPQEPHTSGEEEKVASSKLTEVPTEGLGLRGFRPIVKEATLLK